MYTNVTMKFSVLPMQVFSGQFCVTFFSPSGVQFILPSLKSYCDLQTLKVSHLHCTPDYNSGCVTESTQNFKLPIY